jgi:osmoprotectant transport system permease protein
VSGRVLACLVLALGLLAAAGPGSAAEPAARPIVVASKNFSEGYLLAELVAQQLEASGLPVERRFGLGGTMICYQALRNDEIDLYVEYTGTLAQAVLKLSDPATMTVPALAAQVAALGLALLDPLGFDNTYAIAVPTATAQRLGLRSISDLREHPDLRLVFSHEFLERQDGWPGLRAAYELPQAPTGIEHALAYQALTEGAIDGTDAYSTDGELKRYGLTVLDDDRAFFPEYRPVPLVRAAVRDRVAPVLAALAGRVSDEQMQALNAEVVFEGRSFAEVARGFLLREGLIAAGAGVAAASWQRELLGHVLQHLKLTGLALGFATVLALGLSLAIFRHAALSRGVLYGASLLQTVPSIALLALMIPLFGIGVLPAVIALFLYALLPIVRNALTALTTVDPTLARTAAAMGLTEREQLRHLYLPLALPGIFAGIRTAAVICIGTATLAAFIGAGGLGDPIVTGLSLNDTRLILRGAVPAALLAVCTELLFEGLERVFLPQHLRR